MSAKETLTAETSLSVLCPLAFSTLANRSHLSDTSKCVWKTQLFLSSRNTVHNRPRSNKRNLEERFLKLDFFSGESHHHHYNNVTFCPAPNVTYNGSLLDDGASGNSNEDSGVGNVDLKLGPSFRAVRDVVFEVQVRE